MVPNTSSWTEPDSALAVWRLSDGRPGHDNQSLGLAEAIARRHPCRLETLGCSRGWRSLRLPRRPADPRVDLLIGAGHATHPALVALSRRHGARAVVIMRPSLPMSWFDLCLVPEHDAPRPHPKLELTAGALNRCRPGDKRPGSAVILVGGPSRHFTWSDEAVLAQVRELAIARRYRTLTLADSPRTPAAVGAGLAQLATDTGSSYHPWRDTPAGWLVETLAACEEAWVSRDSMSMLFEALSAGCRLGILDLPAHGDTRLARASRMLLAEGDAGDLDAWRRAGRLPRSRRPWTEADRCAGLILDRWFGP